VTPASRVAGSLHDRRVRFLESLAGLLGCTGRLAILPDGRRPDVLAVDTRQRLLFVGEGKHSETPNCRATQARLQHYLQWVAAHLCHESATAVCAVCFGREGDARPWLDVLAMLASEVQVTFVRKGFARFEPGLLVVFGVGCAPPPVPLARSSRGLERLPSFAPLTQERPGA
jgi:hypothetical protein